MKKIYSALFVLALSFNMTYALEEGMSYNILKSGQKVVIKEVKDNNIVKIDTWINTGSINEDDKTNGLSHFLEHLFFKGTEKYPTGTMDKILDSKGALVNAATSKDFTHYYIQIPSKDFDLALDLHSNMLLNPLIPRKELERERPVVIEEISKTKDSPTNRMFDNLYSLIYSKSNHPYKRPIIGTKENIENVTREEILAYYNKFYTPDAFTTVIVGDVDKEVALKKVEEAFREQTKRTQEKIKYPKVKQLNKIERKIEEMEINQSHIMIAFLAPKFSITKDNYALDVLSVILGDGKSSILNQELKEKKNLVLSIGASNYSQKDSGMFYIYSLTKPTQENEVEKNIMQELQKIKNGEFDENLIAKAKNQIKTDTYYSRESISNISSDLGYDFTFIQDKNYYENYLKNIDKVSKQDILRVANKYLTLDKYAISIVKPKNTNLKEISDKKEQNFGAYEVLEVNENVKKIKLENGINLIAKKKTSNSIIALDIAIKGSKTLENKPTVALLTALSALSGTKEFTNSQLAQYLDENGIKIALNSANDNFSIVLQTTKDNLEKAFYVLDEVINHPAFLDSEIEKIKARKIQELKSFKDNTSSYVFDEFKKQAFKDTLYGQNHEFILNNIKNVSRNDIVEYYSKLINPKNITISIVGDIDENYIAQKINEIIKVNPKGVDFSFANQKYNKFEPTANVEKILYKKDIEAIWLALGFKTCNIENRKDIATLNVINAILGEGMSSRLFVKLREEKGLAYTVGSSLINYVKDGAFVAYIGTNENSIEEARNGILNEIDILKKEMITTNELNNAKDKILGKLLLSLETNMDEADLLNWYSMIGRDLNALEEYKKLIKEVSQSDVIEVANKYFSKPYIYVICKKGK